MKKKNLINRILRRDLKNEEVESPTLATPKEPIIKVDKRPINKVIAEALKYNSSEKMKPTAFTEDIIFYNNGQINKYMKNYILISKTTMDNVITIDIVDDIKQKNNISFKQSYLIPILNDLLKNHKSISHKLLPSDITIVNDLNEIENAKKYGNSAIYFDQKGKRVLRLYFTCIKKFNDSNLYNHQTKKQ